MVFVSGLFLGFFQGFGFHKELVLLSPQFVFISVLSGWNVIKEEVLDLFVEILGQLYARREYEDFKLVIDAPRCLLYHHVLVSGPDLDHFLVGGRVLEVGSLDVMSRVAWKHNHAVGLRVDPVFDDDFVDIDADFALTVVINEVGA